MRTARCQKSAHSGHASASWGRKRAYLGGGERVVVPEPDDVAVGKGVDARGVHGVDVEPVSAQLQVVDDLLLKDVTDIGAGRDAVAGEPLLRHRGAAHDVPPLQHLHLQPCPGQVASGDQAIVTRPDDYDPLVLDHGKLLYAGAEQSACIWKAPVVTAD